MFVKQETISGPLQGITFTVITLNRESICTCRERNHSQFPLRHIDVTRATSTILDVMLERSRRLLEHRRRPRPFRFVDMIPTIHHIGRKNLQMGIHGPGEWLTKKQRTSWPDYLWPEIWKSNSEAAQRKEKQKWTIEKTKLDNGRRLCGIYFIDQADSEFQETIENARRKLEVPMPAAMPCKIRTRTDKNTCRTPDAPKTKYALRESVWKELYIKIEKYCHGS